MPLVKGASPEVFTQNFGELVRAGHAPTQAAAIAYRAAEGADLAAGILYRAGDSVLLLLRSGNTRDFPLHWGLPGGGIEEGETPEQAAIRESQEETGHAPTDPLAVIDYADGFTTFALNVPEPFAPVLNGEHVGYVWAPLSALPQPMHPGCSATLAALPALGVGMDDDRWITVENGEHVLLGEGGEIKGGMAGKFTGEHISSVAKSSPSAAHGGASGDPHSSAKSSFSAQEKKAVTDYSSDKTDPSKGKFKPAYQEINAGLRKDGAAPKQHAETVKSLDKAFENAGAKEAFTVYRGVDKNFAGQLSAGKSFTDKGFSSTTGDKDIAKEFAGGNGVIMHISVPKGAKALSLQGVSKYPNEKEVLLNRGAKYKVTGESKDEKGNRVLHVEYQG